MITSTKLYIPVVNLSINDNIKLLENAKQRPKRTISWNKYRSEITTQPKNNNLDYLVDPTFRNINRLFVLLFQNGDNDPKRDSFEKYYILSVEIKDFNGLINNKSFFDQPVKNKQEGYENPIEMSRMMTIQQETYQIICISKLLLTHCYRFIKTNKYKYSSNELIIRIYWLHAKSIFLVIFRLR